MNPVEFTKRWINGMKNLSHEAQLKSFIAGAYGNLFGFAGGAITMAYFVFFGNQWQWWWSVVILIFTFFITLVDLISKKQQLKSLHEMDETMKNLEGVKL